MKKVLFATTALVATAGVAAADVSLSGSAGAGLFYDNTSDTTDVYNSVTLDVTFSGESDNGLSFGATMDATVGTDLDIGEVGTDEFDTPGAVNAAEDGNFGLGSIFISGEFGTLTFDRDGLDNAYDDDFHHDFSYEYGVDGFDLFLSYNVDGTSGAGELWSLAVSYDAEPISAFLETDDSNELHLGAAYDVTPELNLGLEYETDGEVTTLTAAYDAGMVSFGVEANSDDEWGLDLGYSANGVSVDLSTDENTEWEAIGAYDLGGGLEIVGGTAHTGNWYLGAAMSF